MIFIGLNSDLITKYTRHKVYVHECYSCGRIRSQLARLRAKGDVEVIDTRLSKELAEEHLQILKNAGMDTGSYHAVVVYDGTTKLLREI